MLAQSMGAETLGLRSRRALSLTAHASFTQPNLEIRTQKSLNPLARGRVNLIRPRVGQFESTGGRNGVYVQVLHKPRFGEPVVPWSGIRFELLEAEAYRTAQALIEAATNDDRERSLAVVESLRSNARKAAEPARPERSASKWGSGPRFTRTQGR